jgi:cytochrome c-type biogenesis protein CcmH
MSDMVGLWLGALALVLLCLAVLLPSLLRDAAQPVTGSDDALRALYQAQLQELAREHRAGSLDAADLAQAEDELQRRLLQELAQRAQPRAWRQRPWLPRASALVLAVLLPVAAWGLYVQVGDPQAAARLAQADAMGHSAGQAQVEAMVAGLAQRLQAQPDNLPGWVMLARSYETLERYADAAQAYQGALQTVQAQGLEAAEQARLWADLADSQASAQQGRLDGAAGAAITQALRLDAQQPKALALAGAAALQAGNPRAARDHWQALLALLEPGSDVALQVQDDLVKLELLLREPAAAPAQPSAR